MKDIVGRYVETGGRCTVGYCARNGSKFTGSNYMVSEVRIILEILVLGPEAHFNTLRHFLVLSTLALPTISIFSSDPT